MRQTSDYFWGLNKNMNCAFPLKKSKRLFSVYEFFNDSFNEFFSIYVQLKMSKICPGN